ncbi:uncharacterized protein V6R79_006195 [Siganus canaliculatus]
MGFLGGDVTTACSDTQRIARQQSQEDDLLLPRNLEKPLGRSWGPGAGSNSHFCPEPSFSAALGFASYFTFNLSFFSRNALLRYDHLLTDAAGGHLGSNSDILERFMPSGGTEMVQTSVGFSFFLLFSSHFLSDELIAKHERNLIVAQSQNQRRSESHSFLLISSGVDASRRFVSTLQRSAAARRFAQRLTEEQQLRFILSH